MKYAYRLSVLALILFLAACGTTKVKPKTSAEKYFREGEVYLEKKLYEDAIASWEKVRDTYYSPELSMLAELKIAETYYISERYSEAATAFSDFLNNHPNDFRADTILYRLGLSYYQQILAADRDQTNTENALTTFQQLQRRFPNNQNAQEVSHLIQRCKTRLAEHEVYVGAYYLKKKFYQPAIKRLENVLSTFPEYYYRDEAFYYLGRAYYKTGQKDKARKTFQLLIDQFPGSDFTDKARTFIEEKNL